jgi:D-alanyl-D-alanine carboxypeptidase
MIWVLSVLPVILAVVQMARPLPVPSLTLAREARYTFGGGEPDLPWPAEGLAAVEVEGVGVMGTKGEQRPAPIASVAKTMTAYVILRDHALKGRADGPMIEVDQQAEDESNAPDESTVPIRKGQKLTEKQMLQLLMIPSGNNAARLLARWDSQSEGAFVQKMNDAAKTLGMDNTIYTDPSGLKATTVSTPLDQLKLAKTVMRDPVFREIVNTPQIEISGVPGTIYNNNGWALLKPGVNGIKTGSSTAAGGNLLWSADTMVDGTKRRIVGAVFGVRTGATVHDKLQKAIADSITLIQAAQKAVESATVIKKGDVVGYVDDGLGGRTPVVPTEDLEGIGWRGLQGEIRVEGDSIPRSAPAGTVVGEVSIGTGTGKATAPLVLQSTLEEPDLTAKLTRALR